MQLRLTLTVQDMWQAARERSMQRQAAKAAAASATAAVSELSADEEEIVKPFAFRSIGGSQATAGDNQLCEEAATGEAQPTAERKNCGCLRCKVCFMRFAHPVAC